MAIGSFFNPILAGGGGTASMDVDFIASTQSFNLGTEVTFTNLSTPVPVFNFWQFGDSSFSTASNPNKTFNTRGTFSITLNACDFISGGIETKTNYIVVGGFIPPDITDCVLWLDGADQSSLLLVSGGVAEWFDKSGNNYHFNSPVTTRPTYDTTEKSVVFNGTNNRLERVNTNALNPKNSTTFVVLKSDVTTTGQFTYIADRTSSSALAYASLFYDNFNDTAIGGTSPRDIWSSAARNTANQFRAARYITKQAGKNVKQLSTISWIDANLCLRYNGVLQSTDWTGSPSAPSPGTCQTDATIAAGTHEVTRIGSTALSTPSQFSKGDIYEIIRYNRELTTQEREEVEAYLIEKWGIT
jgi:PKD repeat protein